MSQHVNEFPQAQILFKNAANVAELEGIAVKFLDNKNFYQAELAMEEIERRQGRFSFLNFSDRLRKAAAEALPFLAEDQGEGTLDFIRGAFAYRSRQYELGQVALQQAVVANPANNRARLYLAYCLLSLNRRGTFPEVLEPVLKAERTEWQVYDMSLELLCEYYISEGNAERVREIAESSLRDAGERAPALVHMGTSGVILGDPRAASWFKKAEAAPGSLLPVSRGIQTVLDEKTWKSPLNLLGWGLRQLPKLRFLASPASRVRPDFVIVVTADSEYFRRYFESFVDAVFLSNGAVPVHLHFVNPAEGDLEHLDGVIKKWADRLTINVSIEHAAFAERAYYASARFLRMRALLWRYKCPLLMSDMNIVLRSDVRPLLGDATSSVSLKLTASEGFPWRRVDAKLFVIKPTHQGIRFVADVEAYLLACFGKLTDDRNELWFCDQNAIFWAMALWQRAGHNDMFFDISAVEKPILGSGSAVNARAVKNDPAAAMKRAVQGLRIQKAPGAWRKHVPEEPEQAALYLVEAMRVLSELKRRDDAIEAGLRAHDTGALGEEDAFTLLRLLISAAQFEQALKIATALEEHGVTRQGRLKAVQAEIANGLGRREDAADLAIAAAELTPQDSSALGLAGYYLLRAEKFAPAKDYLEKSVAIAPQALTYSRLSQCAEKLGDLENAVAFARTSVELDGKNEHRLSDAGRLELRGGDNNNAIKYMTKAVALSRRGTNLQRLATAYQRSGALAQAKDLLAEAVASTPGNADYLADLGDVCANLGENDQASQALIDAAKAGAKSVVLQLRVSGIFERLGNVAAALEYVHAALALDGQSRAATVALKRLEAIGGPSA